MCVLSIAPAQQIHDRADLEAACINNPDGFGYAIHTGRHILRRRSMDANYIIDRYLEDRSRFMEGPSMFHARIATSGKVDNSGCHPFFLTDTSKVVMGHNGILPLDMQKIGGWKSDTRFFVEDIIKRDGGVSALADPEYLALIEKWMGSGNKIAFLSADRRLPPYVILNEKAGHWEDGIWWSNYSYSWYSTSSSKYVPVRKSPVRIWEVVDGVLKETTNNTDTDDDTDDSSIQWEDSECPFCGGKLSEVMMEDGQCDHCWSDLLDEPHTDSAWCYCMACQNEQIADMENFLDGDRY